MTKHAKLTLPMIAHLTRLVGGVSRSAYPGLSLRTLGALRQRGLVEAEYGVGSIAMPHSSIKWRITDAGRAALALATSPTA